MTKPVFFGGHWGSRGLLFSDPVGYSEQWIGQVFVPPAVDAGNLAANSRCHRVPTEGLSGSKCHELTRSTSVNKDFKGDFVAGIS